MTDRRKGGRNPKLDPTVNRYCVRFTGEENKRLLAMFKQSGMQYMACFIKAQFFGQEFRTFTDDGSMKPYNDKLSSLHSQFRQLGNDYNLALKELKVRFLSLMLPACYVVWRNPLCKWRRSWIGQGV